MKKELFLTLFFVSLLFFCISCNRKDKDYLFPVCENGLFGYINKNGEMVIEPKYYRANFFSEGLASVCNDVGYGFIDTRGNVIIDYQFKDVLGGRFICGIAPIATLDDKFGYVNRDGKIFALGLSKISVRPDSEGLLVYYKDGKHGFVDTNGEVVIKPQFDDVREFSDGMAAVKLNNKWGYINKNGKMVIDCKYENALEFKEGLAPIQVFGLWGFIDKTGKNIIKAQYYYANCFSDGLARVTSASTRRNGYIDKNGKLVIGFKYSNGHPFKEGLAIVDLKKEGIVDKKGRTVARFLYDRIEPFSEGLAVVQKGTKYGYIDKKGNVVIPLKFERAYGFNNGLALVYVSKSEQVEPEEKHIGDKDVVMIKDPRLWSDGLWGYIDKDGNMIYSCLCK